MPLHYTQADSVFSALIRFLRLCGLSDLAPSEIGVISHHTEFRSEYEEYFQCPVSFGVEEGFMAFDARTLDWRLPYADPSLLELARVHADTMLTRQTTLDGLAQSVRAILGSRHFSEISCAEVAESLGISHRTLQRRLAEVGHTFRELLEAARMEEAFHLLNQSSLPLSEIAYKLGYSEPSSFSRAVRNWSGLTPGQHRREAQHGEKFSGTAAAHVHPLRTI